MELTLLQCVQKLLVVDIGQPIFVLLLWNQCLPVSLILHRVANSFKHTGIPNAPTHKVVHNACFLLAFQHYLLETTNLPDLLHQEFSVGCKYILHCLFVETIWLDVEQAAEETALLQWQIAVLYRYVVLRSFFVLVIVDAVEETDVVERRANLKQILIHFSVQIDLQVLIARVVLLEKVAEIHQYAEEEWTEQSEQPDVIFKFEKQSVQKLGKAMWQRVNVNADLGQLSQCLTSIDSISVFVLEVTVSDSQHLALKTEHHQLP